MKKEQTASAKGLADLTPSKRRQIIVADSEKSQELQKNTTLEIVLEVSRRINPLANLLVDILLPGELWGSPKQLSRRVLPYPILDPGQAVDLFSFPPGHPVNGMAYACADLEPRHYVPFASFHEYMWQQKMGAFTRLCSRLGARRVTVAYAEEDGIDITVSVGASGIASAKGGYTKQGKADAKIYREFGKPEIPLVETSEGWIISEPTWSAMQEERMQGNLLKSEVEVHYDDNMGITADVAALVHGLKIEIGGAFKEFVRKKWVFQVEFWPKSDIPSGNKTK